MHNKKQLTDTFQERALAVIEDENYDIVVDGGFTPEDFATAATNIFRNLLTPVGQTWELKHFAISVYTMGLNWKIRNDIPSFVSCSDDNGTGVSRSEHYILSRCYDVYEDDVKTLLDMMNEAWYLMTNNQ